GKPVDEKELRIVFIGGNLHDAKTAFSGRNSIVLGAERLHVEQLAVASELMRRRPSQRKVRRKLNLLTIEPIAPRTGRPWRVPGVIYTALCRPTRPSWPITAL